jgi:hypothetical protein
MRSDVLARIVQGVALCTGLCALALWLIASAAAASLESPSNDDFLSAFPINSPGTRLNGFEDVRDTAGASLQSNIFDPCDSSSCPAGPPEISTCKGILYGRTIWYSFFPDRNGQVVIRTTGIPNVIALYTYHPQTSQLALLECAKGSRFGVNDLHASVQRGLEYALQIGGRNGQGNILNTQLSFASNRRLPLPPFLTKAVLGLAGGAANLLRFRFIGATEGESVAAACTSCGTTTFRAREKHGNVIVVNATPPPTFRSRMQVLVAATSPSQIGRFRLYAAHVAPYGLKLVSSGCLAPGVTSVDAAMVKQLSLLTQIPCPKVSVRSRGGEYVFWEDAAGRLWEKRFSGGTWAPSRQLKATKLGSGPTVAVHANGEQDVFWKGRAGSLWETWYTTKWYGPGDFGGHRLASPGAQLESAPAAGVDAEGNEYVFWQGTDDGLWAMSFSDGEWSQTPVELSAAGRLGSGPSVAVHGNGQQDVFWKGTNGNLWEWSSASGRNGSKDLLGGQLGSAPTVGLDAAGNEYVFWQGTDQGLWEAFCPQGRCGRPFPLPNAGKIGSAPTVAVYADGQQDVFYRGTNGRLYETWYTGKWNGPIALTLGQIKAGTAPTAGVSAVSQHPPA